jgi:serine/threonine protein kinase/tetratricopeptide (TPR) repeat protein
MTRGDTHTNPKAPGERSAVLADIVDRLTARVQAGKLLDPDAVAAEYPEFADDLRQLLPAVGLLGELSRSREVFGAGAAPAGEAGGTLGDYRIVREAGRGGMGVVYEAEQLSLRRRVALKVLPFAAVMDPRHLQRFKNEALAAASLDHPHVVKVYGVGCKRGVHFIAMQYIDGRTLAELIRERRDGPAARPVGGTDVTRTYAADVTTDRPPGTASEGRNTRTPMDAAYARRVTQWGIQAAEGLEHAHSLGIVHRDVKPGNLLVDGRGEVFVADFGLAKVVSDPGVTGAGDLLGTVRYMSPEQAGAKHDLVDHRSDVYSLGVTLYELLTLAPAFEGTDRLSILTKLTTTDPTTPRKLDRRIPRDLETVVLKAMDKDPARRYQSARELADDLRRVLGNESVKAKRATLLDRAGKWTRRHRATVWSGVALLAVTAVVASGAVLVVWQQKEAKDQALREKTDALTDKDKALMEKSAALAEKDVALDRADANFKRADANLRTALRALGANRAALQKVREPFQVLGLAREMVGVAAAAVAQYPDQLEYRKLLWESYQSLCHSCEPCRAYREAAETYVKCADLLDQTAIDFPGARSPFSEERDMMMVAYLENAASHFLRIGRHADAEMASRRAIGLSEQAERREPAIAYLAVYFRARARMRLGEIHAEEGRIQEAEREYQAGLALVARLKPDDPDPGLHQLALARGWSGLAGLHAARGEGNAAREAYRKAAGHAEKSPNLFLAEFLADCPDPTFRQPRRALELARNAYSARGQDINDRRVLALALVRNGEWHDMIHLFPRPHVSGPDPVEQFAHLLALHHTGEPVQARDMYYQLIQQGIEYNPRNDQIARLRSETAEVLGVIAPSPRAVR